MTIPRALTWAAILASGHVAYADAPADCSEESLQQVVTTVAEAPSEVRRPLLADGLRAACGPALSKGQLAWLLHWSRGEQPPPTAEADSARAARDAFCPKGRKLGAAPATPDWDDHLQMLWSKCRIEKQGWIGWDEFRNGGGPDTLLLAGALHRALSPYSEGASRAIARWIAGHPADPRDALPPDTLGAFFPAAAGLELVQSTSLKSPFAGCVPVVTLGPEVLKVNGQPATWSTLEDGVAPCRDLTPRTEEETFRGEVHLVVDGTTPYRRVVDTMATLWHQDYGSFGLIVGKGATHTDSGSPLNDPSEYTGMSRVDVMLPPGPIALPDSGSSLGLGGELEPPSTTPPSQPSPQVEPTSGGLMDLTGGIGGGLGGGIGGDFGPQGLNPGQPQQQPSLHIHVGLERWTISDGLGGVKTLPVGETQALHAHLSGLAARWPGTFEVTLSADDATPLSTLVRVVDHAREHIEALGARPRGRTGRGEMFPYVFFAPSAPAPDISETRDGSESMTSESVHPSVTPLEPMVMGTMEASVLQGVISRAEDAVLACYETGLAEVTDLSGKLVMKLTIAPSGAVSSARMRSSTLEHPGVEQCVVDLISHLTFPAIEGDGITIVSSAWRFELD